MQELDIEIRAANVKDLEVVCGFIKKLAQHLSLPFQSNMRDLKHILFSETTHIQTYLIYDTKNPIGVIIVYEMISTFIGKKFLRIEDVYLDAQYRGNGVGEIIYKFIVEIAKKNNCHHIEGITTNINLEMHQFIKKHKGYLEDHWSRFIIPI